MTLVVHAAADDAPSFLSLVKSAAEGIVASSGLRRLSLVHIDNWFDRKWLGFEGKILGAVGVWCDSEKPVLPPFVPGRVLAEESWDFIAGLPAQRSEQAPLHVKRPSGTGCPRHVSTIAPDTALVWYSGRTQPNGRGAVMAYVPDHGRYWMWHVGLRGPDWKIAHSRGITHERFAALLARGAGAERASVRE